MASFKYNSNPEKGNPGIIEYISNNTTNAKANNDTKTPFLSFEVKELFISGSSSSNVYFPNFGTIYFSVIIIPK